MLSDHFEFINLINDESLVLYYEILKSLLELHTTGILEH